MSAPPNRTDSVANKLREEILSGRYKPGERLPAERDLASQLGVNRSSVREALKRLEQLGLVAIRRGDGTTVRHLHEASIEIVRHLLLVDGQVNRRLLEQMLDVHEMLLAGAAYLAVERGGPEPLERARELVRSLGEAHGALAFHELANELVDIITEASGNLVLRLFRNTFHPAVAEAALPLLPYLEADRAGVDAAVATIDAALAASDPAATERAVRSLYRLRRRSLAKALDAFETRLQAGATSR